MQCKSYILARKTLFKDPQFSDEIPPTEKDLRAYLNSVDEVKHLLQAAVSRAKRAGITREVLLSSMDECYQEVTSFSNIALPQDLDDLLDLGVSMECDSSINGGFFQEGREINGALRDEGVWSRNTRHGILHKQGSIDRWRNIF